jgi:hypothetical protein
MQHIGGSKPGERRGGRQKGTPNKVTAELRLIAADYGPAAVKELVAIGLDPETKSKSDGTRIAAIRELLDRGYGKPSQALEHSVAVGQFDPTKLTDEELEAVVDDYALKAGYVRLTPTAK